MIVDFGNDSPETMGIFGLTWEEKVAAFTKKQLKGTAAAKKLSAFFQPGGYNITLIKNLYNEYAALMSKGYQPVSFSVSPDASGNGGTLSKQSLSLAAQIADRTNVDVSIVIKFFHALFVLSRDGKIPFAKWNPAGWKESTEARKTFTTERGVFEKVQSAAVKAGGTSKMVLIVAGMGVAAYLLSQLKTFTHKG
ncbi:MAG: hypothetical protein PHE88_12355 [Elusimicrobia bacterium]|nr:hypothetical protein [Elusimicrobiota bacterium]